MTSNLKAAGLQTETTGELARYYLVRAIVAAAWVAAAVAVGSAHAGAAAILLVSYPAWDALANWFDARSSGGLRANSSQALNVVVSLVAAVAVAGALQSGMNAVLAVFGIWAFAAGLAQLVTGIRRWRTFGAQWAMILSGGQSMIVGVVFVTLGWRRQGADDTRCRPLRSFRRVLLSRLCVVADRCQPPANRLIAACDR